MRVAKTAAYILRHRVDLAEEKEDVDVFGLKREPPKD